MLRRMSPPSQPNLAAYAKPIDPERFEQLIAEYVGCPGQELAVLLGTAYPALRAAHDWQLEGLGRVLEEGWHSPRGAADYALRFREACGELDDQARVRRGLRRVAWIEKARIALRELLPRHKGGGGIDETAQELSLLASMGFEVALTEAMIGVEERFGAPLLHDGSRSSFVVFGMGKLGGYELNAGSDVDVIFFYDSDDGASETSLHDHWSRVARRAVANLDDMTDDGIVWRVDLRLRPEGSRGALVNSVAAADRYYETFGRLWERTAMLRARPIAGSRELGATLEREVIGPFVYKRQVSPAIATAMIEMVQRSRMELSEDPDRDLKLGPGGIRETEFFIQALQLIWGGQYPALHTQRTLPALDRLLGHGLVTHVEARDMGEAYWLLRRAEHAVQWSTGVQTHLLPAAGPDFERLARALAFDDGEHFRTRLQRARDVVTAHFASLAPEAPRPPSKYHHILSNLERGGLPLEKAVAETLGAGEVAQHLEALASNPWGLLGSLTHDRYPSLSDIVMDSVVNSPDPAVCARYLRSFFQRFADQGPYVKPLASDHRLMRRFSNLLGSSELIGDHVTANPDLADIVLFSSGPKTDAHARSMVAEELAEYERWLEATGDTDVHERREVMAGALRRAKQRVMVEVAVADLSGELGTRDTTSTLSALADEIMEQAVRFEIGGEPVGLTVIAVGKLGGRDIGYGSDLDVIFIYDREKAPEGTYPGEYFGRIGQRIIRLISSPHVSGRGYELDTRLRPSGAQGLLVTSYRAFARYHGVSLEEPTGEDAPSVMSSGEAWERQALTRARICAGDWELGERVMAVAQEAAFERGAPPAKELHHLRLRMQHELGREREDRRYIKTGRGGLLDVEFAVQWLQMQHGRDVTLRTPDIGQALAALVDGGYLDQRHHDVLRDSYLFLRRLEQRIHVRSTSATSYLDKNEPGLPQLARRMGFRPGVWGDAQANLWREYERVTAAVRSTYLAVLGLEAEDED